MPTEAVKDRETVSDHSTTGHAFTYTVKAPKGMALVLE